jgi:hypothetical protein
VYQYCRCVQLLHSRAGSKQKTPKTKKPADLLITHITAAFILPILYVVIQWGGKSNYIICSLVYVKFEIYSRPGVDKKNITQS